MKMLSYLEAAQDFIADIGGIDSLYYLTDWEWEYESCCPPNSFLKNGATKAVIIFPNEKYVIKIPFIGEKCDDEEYREHTTSCSSHYSYVGQLNGQFQNAVTENCDWDYCALEQEFYQLAISEGIEEFFLETFKIGDYEGHPIYLQKKATIYDESDIKGSKKSEKIYSTYFNSGEILNLNFCALVIDLYGLEKMDCLNSFLNKAGINDLHSNNMGVYKKRPVFFDYSGFGD